MSRFWYNLSPIIQKSDCRGILEVLEKHAFVVCIYYKRMWLKVKNLKLFRNYLVVGWKSINFATVKLINETKL